MWFRECLDICGFVLIVVIVDDVCISWLWVLYWGCVMGCLLVVWENIWSWVLCSWLVVGCFVVWWFLVCCFLWWWVVYWFLGLCRFSWLIWVLVVNCWFWLWFWSWLYVVCWWVVGWVVVLVCYLCRWWSGVFCLLVIGWWLLWWVWWCFWICCCFCCWYWWSLYCRSGIWFLYDFFCGLIIDCSWWIGRIWLVGLYLCFCFVMCRKFFWLCKLLFFVWFVLFVVD